MHYNAIKFNPIVTIQMTSSSDISVINIAIIVYRHLGCWP